MNTGACTGPRSGQDGVLEAFGKHLRPFVPFLPGLECLMDYPSYICCVNSNGVTRGILTCTFCPSSLRLLHANPLL